VVLGTDHQVDVVGVVTGDIDDLTIGDAYALRGDSGSGDEILTCDSLLLYNSDPEMEQTIIVKEGATIQTR